MKLPTMFVRSHRHRFQHVILPTEMDGEFQCVVTPAWQLKTPFVERIDRMRMPHIGGVVFTIEDGKCQVKRKMYKLPGPKPIKI
jgi:hypothetical protein